MAKDEGNGSKFDAVKLIYLLVVLIFGLGIAYGLMKNQQGVNSKEIDKRASKESFNLHMTQQTRQFESLGKSIDKGFGRIDKRLANIEKK
ncbi:hypothetical protein LCGC14_2618800 [marine sediment metagenome]|uniref:Uncharacterized protein n=1 Tax=marine sediment metagenome TaxID=412755 RepID=A0A0F9ARA0_9ZZZZ